MSLFVIYVDTINGYFLLSIGFNTNLSVVFKLFMIAICIFGLSSSRKYSFLFSFILLFLGLTISFIHTITLNLSLSGFINSFSLYLKVFSWFIFYIYLTEYVYSKPYAYDKDFFYLNSFFYLYFLGILLNVFSSLFGFGYSTYGDGTGSKGYIYAGNEIGGAFILVFSVLTYCCLKKQKYYRFILLCLIGFLISIMLATKTAFLGVILVVLASFTFFFSQNRMFFGAMTALFFACIIVVLFSVENLFLYLGFYDRLIYFIEKNGILTALLSNRDVFLNDLFFDFFLTRPFSDIIFGVGREGLSHLYKDIIEMDFFDIWMWFGSLAISIWFIFLCYVTYRIFKIKAKVERRYFSFVWCCMIVVSFITGHFFISGMTSIVIPFFLVFIFNASKMEMK